LAGRRRIIVGLGEQRPQFLPLDRAKLGRRRLLVVGRTRAIERLDRRERLALEQGLLGGPHPPLPLGEGWQRGDHLPPLLVIGPLADPCLDGGPVLRRDQPERDQRLDLRQAVLVQFRRPLRQEQAPDAAQPPAAHEVVGGVHHAAGLRIGDAALGREQVRLVDDEMERPAVGAEQRLGKGGEEPRALADRHQHRIDDQREIALGHEPTQALAVLLGKRGVAVLAANDRDRVAGRLAVREQAQAPPCAGRVDDADPPAAVEQPFDEALRAIGFPRPGFAEDADVAAENGVELVGRHAAARSASMFRRSHRKVSATTSTSLFQASSPCSSRQSSSKASEGVGAALSLSGSPVQPYQPSLPGLMPSSRAPRSVMLNRNSRRASVTVSVSRLAQRGMKMPGSAALVIR
jgi:hypothetical protein